MSRIQAREALSRCVILLTVPVNACPLPPTAWLRFLDFAGSILARPAEIVDGTLTARGPGLGLEWDEAAVKKYLA